MTKAQRDRKVAAALKRVDEARALLAAVADDLAERSWRLSMDERDEWRRVVDLVSPLERHPYTRSAS
jgi:3',5'-cyclic AMP phosphodiesterase CpdA